MADKFVTVKTFSLALEAQLAKNLLQTEGIESFLTGEFSADVLLANPALGDQVRLQVHERDAQRAAGILAAHEASLDDDWEDRAENADVWVCSLCGSPVSNSLPVCYACETPREGIRAEPPPTATGIRPTGASATPPDTVQKPEGVPAKTAAPGRTPAGAGDEEDEDEEEEGEELSPGDDLARRAFWASLFGVALPCPVLPFAWYCLARVLSYPGELSPGGRRHFYWATLVNGLAVLGWVALCAGMAHH